MTTLLAGLTSFSHAPLVLFIVAGLAFGALSALGLLGMGIAALAGASPFGVAAGVAFGVLLWSTILFGIAVVGLYLARVHREALGRPRYIVESTSGFDPR